METKHDEEGENGVSIHLETHSRSSSSSSSSSYLSPQNLPDTPTDSPPAQVMERDENVDEGLKGYDPDRIPSSVFERRKSNIPAEWSCTSNESLFSIHLGRNSFYGNDLMKSGELYKSGELLAYSPALPMPPPPGSELSKPVKQEPSKILVLDDSDKEEEVVVLVQEEDKRESHEKEQHPAVSWKTPTTSYRSNRSSNSAHSFSFPILAGAASESSNAETEERKKQGKESQESQQQQPEEAVSNQKPSSIMCRWFSCFPPCPWCCSSHSPCSCS